MENLAKWGQLWSSSEPKKCKPINCSSAISHSFGFYPALWSWPLQGLCTCVCVCDNSTPDPLTHCWHCFPAYCCIYFWSLMEKTHLVFSCVGNVKLKHSALIAQTWVVTALTQSKMILLIKVKSLWGSFS